VIGNGVSGMPREREKPANMSLRLENWIIAL